MRELWNSRMGYICPGKSCKNNKRKLSENPPNEQDFNFRKHSINLSGSNLISAINKDIIPNSGFVKTYKLVNDFETWFHFLVYLQKLGEKKEKKKLKICRMTMI